MKVKSRREEIMKFFKLGSNLGLFPRAGRPFFLLTHKKKRAKTKRFELHFVAGHTLNKSIRIVSVHSPAEQQQLRGHPMQEATLAVLSLHLVGSFGWIAMTCLSSPNSADSAHGGHDVAVSDAAWD